MTGLILPSRQRAKN